MKASYNVHIYGHFSAKSSHSESNHLSSLFSKVEQICLVIFPEEKNTTEKFWQYLKQNEMSSYI